MLEQEILKPIMQYLKIKENQGEAYCFRSASGGIKTENRFFRTGRSGLQDITCLIAGRFVAIEVKSPTGKQSHEQKEIQRLIEKHGGEYHIARSVTDVQNIFKQLKPTK